jgi:mannose-1-phosphate guanylyltransferase
MKLVLLSGGSGKRLWPLSNSSRSKQFIKTLRNSQHEWESMLQRVWRQLDSKGLSDVAYISTSTAQVDIIQNQLGSQVPLIIEPERRDTFPAVALAATYFYSESGADLNEVITVMPVDPYADDHFFDTVKALEDVIRQSGADLALIGVNPSYPSEKYGYIIPDRQAASGNQPFARVDFFKEKPSAEQAGVLIQQHALWNCGVFSFSLGYLLSLLREKKWPVQYAELRQQYAKLPRTSFDYEVVEKAEQVVVVPYSGGWRDLGTWNTLTEEIHTNLIGKGVISEDCKRTHVINELDIPVAVLGVSDVVVAAGPDGILVSDKAASHRVKDYVNRIELRPMFEERRWGWYKVLDYQTLADGRELLTKRICVFAGKNLSYQFHQMREEIWTIVAGEGEFVLDGQWFQVKPGDVLKIPVGAKHGVKALSELEIIEIQMGAKLVEEDIVRLYLSWEDVKNAL